MSIIVTGSITNARLGYLNLFTEGTVTSSSETVGFEAANAYDLKQYDWWKPATSGTNWLRVSFASAQQADYMAVWGHNLHEVGGSVKPQYSTDGISWNDASIAYAPASGRTIYIGFGLQIAAHWRCLVETTGQAIIAGIQIGKALSLPEMKPGFSPATLSPKIISKTAMSELGINLGVSVLRSGISGQIKLNNLDPDWVRSDLVPCIQHFANGKPAVFSWDYASHNNEAALIWTTKQIDPPTYQDPLYMEATIDFKGVE